MTLPPQARGSRRPDGRWTLALAGLAVAVRLLVLALTLALAPADVADVALLHDGLEYQMRAVAMGEAVGLDAQRLGATGEAAGPLWPQARRFAPGYPLLLLLTAASGVPLPWAALLVAVLGAAAATALLHRLGLSPAAVALFAVLTPSWIAFTSTAMSEGPFTALALAGLLAWRRAGEGGGRRLAVVAGLAFGVATLVRPVGAVLFAALWFVRLLRPAGRRRDGRQPAAATLGFALPPLSWLAVTWAVTGWPPGHLGVYLAADAAPPLAALLGGLAAPGADPLKWAQVVLVVLLAAWALWRLLAVHRRTGRTGEGAGSAAASLHRDWIAWLSSQAAFYLLLPSSWVFECLPRFLAPALPAVAAAVDGALPPPGHPVRRWVAAAVLAALAVGGVAVSLFWNLRALGAP